VKAVLLDVDGTTLLGADPLPGAADLVAWARRGGTRLLWLTNNTSRSREGWRARLAAAGLDPGPGEVYTAGDATIDHLRSLRPAPRVHLVGTPELAADFVAGGILLDDERPDAVVLGYDTTLTYEKLVRASRFLRAGLPFYATHPDVTCPTPDGPIPDVGSFLALFEAATGRRATVIGKPERTMIESALRRLSLAREDVVMVGDRLATDVRMANAAGIPSWLVMTGVTRPEDLAASPDRPTRTFPDLAAVLRALA
jgi:HAD superfamily hydrolase (TIGR01450 family)